MSVFTAAARTTRRHLVRFVLAMALGAASGYGMARLSQALGVTKASLTASDIAGQIMATMFLGAAAYVLMLAVDRRRLARAIECDADTPASNEEVSLFRLQAAVLAGAGLLLAIPTLFSAYARTHPGVGFGLLLGLLALLALQSWMNWRVVSLMDEFMARAFFGAATLAFCGGQAILLAWAAAERLVGAPRLTTWDAFVLLTTLYVAASALHAVAASKR